MRERKKSTDMKERYPVNKKYVYKETERNSYRTIYEKQRKGERQQEREKK